MRRGHIAAFVAAAGLAGCLFPSFDGLRKNGAAPGDDDDDTQTENDGGGTSSSTSSSASSSSGGDPDSGSKTDTGAPVKRVIKCGGTLECDVATSFCCGKISGPSECRPGPFNAASPPEGCDSALACDGSQDCPTGQFCCQNAFGGNHAVCKAGACSDGYTFCHPDAPICPTNEPKCTGDHIGIFGAEPVSCD